MAKNIGACSRLYELSQSLYGLFAFFVVCFIYRHLVNRS